MKGFYDFRLLVVGKGGVLYIFIIGFCKRVNSIRIRFIGTVVVKKIQSNPIQFSLYIPYPTSSQVK